VETTTRTNGGLWSSAPTAKDKSAVQRSVTQLLDTLAPHRVVKRRDEAPSPIEQYRTPDGCILQARDAALSVTWFADNRAQDTIGELQISVWSGVVSRGGSSYRRPAKATVVVEQTARPQQPSLDGAMWRSDDGLEFDTASLAAHCMDLLNKQIGNGRMQSDG
jgi:hypothetical protein